MKPMANNLIVSHIPMEYHGSIVMPESMKDALNTGGVKCFRVHAVGPGRLTRKGVRVPIECEPGDRVLCHSYTTGPTPLDNDRMVISAEMILAVIPHH